MGNHRVSIRLLGLAMGALALSACVADELAIDEDSEGVTDGEGATQWERDRAAVVARCTATRISEGYLITALHCNPLPEIDGVKFYRTSNWPMDPSDYPRWVSSVAVPPGAHAEGDDWIDDDGLFADIAVVKLNERALLKQPYATLAWSYPGDGAYGIKVGAGQHDGDEDMEGYLMRTDDITWTEDDGDGIFRTEEWKLDHGDSGGPFYYGGKLLGVVNGSRGTLPLRARYTSVPQHLDFILDAIHYDWPGGGLLARFHGGNVIEFFYHSSLLRCAYACDRTTSCISFNHSNIGMCQLLSTVTSSVPATTWVTANK